MKRKEIGIIGCFGGKENLLDGQTVKTKTLYNELSDATDWKIFCVDTYYRNKNTLKLICNTLRCLLKCKDIIILLSRNGMRFYFPLLYYYSRVFKKNIYHDVIGGNLPEQISNYPNWLKYLNSFNVNWIEFKSARCRLEEIGVTNVEILPNFKRLNIVSMENIYCNFDEPFHFCTFSRVSKAKGIPDAVDAIECINRNAGRTIAVLDIYGQIDSDYIKDFEILRNEFSNAIRYCGKIDFNQSTNVLKDYYALLFPTHFYGEGFPGTVIDAYASGLPVIATDWHANGEIIDNFKTGIVYPCDKIANLKEAIEWAIKNPDIVSNMRKACIEESKKYQPDTNIRLIISKISKASI